jgi:hypothetical protein
MVNILGSLVYRTIPGIFLVTLYFYKIGENASFYASLIAEFVDLYGFLFTSIHFLLYNVVGYILVILLAFFIQTFIKERR